MKRKLIGEKNILNHIVLTKRELLKNGAKSLSESWWLQALYVDGRNEGLYKDDQ